MEIFSNYCDQIVIPEQRAKTRELLTWVHERFPQLERKIAWNQPMFTDHGTFILGFSVAKKHLAIATESVVTSRFSQDILKAGYDHTQELIRIPWDKPLDYDLLARIIEFNIQDKKDCTSFWRK